MAPTLLDQLVGTVFWLAWRTAGLLALPGLLLSARVRRHLVRVPGPEPGWTWVHGASAGEHRVVAALAPALGPAVWRTHSSLRTPVPRSLPAPLDLPFVAGAWIRRHRPGRLVLVESELWPGWLVACRRLGVPVVVVHARNSRGTARWKAFPPLWRWLMQGVTVVPQSETGDLKRAAPLPESALVLPRPCVIAASTRTGDEARVVAAWRTLSPRPTLVLAPRHPERATEVLSLLGEAGISGQLRTAGGPVASPVLVLDTIGELAALFAQADAAVIGGTWDPALGGHAPSEALAAGVPTVGGPERWGNPEAWKDDRTWEAGPEPDALAMSLREALAAGRQPSPSAPDPQQTVDRLPAPVQVPEQPARPLLWPLVPLVRLVGRLRHGWWGTPVRVAVPVISVGGLTAGGAGKTPVVAWLAEALADHDPWVVSRGYRRSRSGPAVRVGEPGVTPTHDLGDELELLRRRGVPVVSAPDRVAGAQEAARRGAGLILLDDGFSYRRLHRDLDIVCLDGRWPGGEGPLPVGTRREPWSHLARADWLWIHNAGPLDNADPSAPALPVTRPRVRSVLTPERWDTPEGPASLDAVSGPVEVHAGLARPAGFLSALVRLGLDLEQVHLEQDHGHLTGLGPGAVVSEKDAARLPPDAPVRVLRTRLLVAGAEPLLSQIRGLLS